MIDIECLLSPQFNHCSVVQNFSVIYVVRTVSQSRCVKGQQQFRDHPNQFIGLFDTDEIDIAIKYICTE